MEWIYLSPHLDDVALSCGGLVWQQSQTDQPAHIWTICAGEPSAGRLSPFAQSLHARWKTGEQAVARRQAEDMASCVILGAGYRHFELPDCIYRPGGTTGIYFYASEESLWEEIHPGELPLVEMLAQQFARDIPAQAQVICPLALGGHVDHRLTRAVAEQLGRRLWYYMDYPYALKEASAVDTLRLSGWESICFSLSEPALTAWQDAIAAHSSQISTFWPDLAAMRAAIREYQDKLGGMVLLQPG